MEVITSVQVFDRVLKYKTNKLRYKLIYFSFSIQTKIIIACSLSLLGRPSVQGRSYTLPP